MKKIKISMLFLAATLLFANGFSIPKDPCKKMDVCCEEPAPGPCAFYYPEDKGFSCPNSFYVKGEYLLLQVKEDGLEYAMTQDNSGETPLLSTVFPLFGGDIKGYSTEAHNWDWTSGLRFGLGFYLNNYDSWNIEATWTYMRIKNDSGTNSQNNKILMSFWQPLPNQEVSARWSGQLNTLDLKLGKPYHISRYVVFNPHFGIRMAWIERDFLVRNNVWLTSFVTAPDPEDMIAKNDFWGIGPRAGLDTNWHFGSGVYLFGNLSASILLSHFDVMQTIPLPGEEPFYQLKHDFYTNSSNMDIMLGLAWSYLFSKDRYLFSLKAAYEMHYFWDQNRFRRFLGGTTAPISNDEVSRGDLKVNGFSFALQLDF